jgi:riboflavin-specific deaminase-like protein
VKRPFVTANFALSADGRVSTRKLVPSLFSSARDKRRLLEIRAQSDAVLVGARTVASDTMTLGLPAQDLRAARKRRGLPPMPLRVIVSNSGRLSARARVFSSGLPPAVVFSTKQMTARTVQALAGVCDLWLHLADEVNLAEVLGTLREDYGVKRVVCEGGPTLLRALLTAELVDELHVTLCPLVFGGKKAPTLTGMAGEFLPRSASLQLVEMLSAEGECFTRWRVKHEKIPASVRLQLQAQ